MIYTAYVILEPGADRPYFSHTAPTEYQKKPGAKVYQLEIPIPDFSVHDGKIQVVTQQRSGL